MARGWFNLPYPVWAVFCLIIAIVYLFIWPSERVSAETSALSFFLIRWGHSLAWGCLAIMCLLKANRNPALSAWGSRVGMVALPIYFGFLAASYVF